MEKILGACHKVVSELRRPQVYNLIIKKNLPPPLLSADTRWSSNNAMVNSEKNI